MKTFKLFSLEVVEDDKSVEVPLEDGLILNKEDERSTWLIEAYTDLSLHQLNQALGDCQSQAGAAIASRGRHFRLTEGLKNSVQLVIGDADAIVRDGNDQAVVWPRFGTYIDFTEVAALPGAKFNSVTHQITQHLAKACVVQT